MRRLRRLSLTSSALAAIVVLLGLSIVGAAVVDTRTDGAAGPIVVASGGAPASDEGEAAGDAVPGAAGGGGGRSIRRGSGTGAPPDEESPAAVSAPSPEAATPPEAATGESAQGEAPVAPGASGVGGASTGPSVVTTTVPARDAAPRDGIASVAGAAGQGTAWFATVRWPDGASCPDTRLWRVDWASPAPGALLAVTEGLDRLVELDPETGRATAVLATWDAERGRPVGAGVAAAGSGSAPAISADGRTLAFAGERARPVRGGWRACNPDLVLRDVATGDERVIPASPARGDDAVVTESVRRVRWTPTGSALAVTRSYEGDRTVLVDPNAHRTLDDAPSAVDADGRWFPSSVDWLADGRLVLTSWCCYPDHVQAGQVAVVGPDGVPQPMSEPSERADAVDVDPTGHHLAYVRSSSTGASEVVLRRDLGEPVVVAQGFAAVAW